MEMRMHETDWAQKYRPVRLEDMILPTSTKQAFTAMRDSHQGPSLLLHGPAGTGKTTTAMLLNPDNTHKINCSAWSKIAEVTALHKQCNTPSLPTFGRRVVVLDEADCLKPDLQTALRACLEDLSQCNCFVLTANYPQNFIQPLISRLHEVDFGVMAGNALLRAAMLERVKLIVEAEGIAADVSVLRAAVNRWFPDMRKILKQLQFEVALVT